MHHAPNASTLELLAWISRVRPTYTEAIEAWSSWCPRHSVWEDALVEGLVRVARRAERSDVVLTPLGQAMLARYESSENGRLTAAVKPAAGATTAR